MLFTLPCLEHCAGCSEGGTSSPRPRRSLWSSSRMWNNPMEHTLAACATTTLPWKWGKACTSVFSVPLLSSIDGSLCFRMCCRRWRGPRRCLVGTCSCIVSYVVDSRGDRWGHTIPFDVGTYYRSCRKKPLPNALVRCCSSPRRTSSTLKV